MKSEWKNVTLSAVADFNPRETLPKGKLAKKIPMDVLQPFCRKIPAYSEEVFKGGTKFRNGDTLMARITPCLENGKTSRVDILEDGEVGFGSTEYIVFRAKEGVLDSHFLYYLVRSDIVREPAIKSMVGSSGRQRVQTDVLEKLCIKLPSLATQRKIAAVLSSLDDKIETNNAICQNLEELVDALFHKCIEEGNMQVPFLSLVEVQGGGTPKTGQSEYWSGEIPFFTPKDVSVPFTFETGKSLTCEGLAHCNSPLYPAWTTFVTARGTVGKLAMAGLPMAMNQSCYALVGKKIHPILAFMYSRSVVHSLKKKSTGSVFDAIVTRDFETENVKRLSDERKFIDVALPMYERIYILMQENNRLASLRDTLLPRLMSGELDVSAVKL